MLYELEVAGPPNVVELSENDGGTWLLWLHSIGCHSNVLHRRQGLWCPLWNTRWTSRTCENSQVSDHPSIHSYVHTSIYSSINPSINPFSDAPEYCWDMLNEHKYGGMSERKLLLIKRVGGHDHINSL